MKPVIKPGYHVIAGKTRIIVEVEQKDGTISRFESVGPIPEGVLLNTNEVYGHVGSVHRWDADAQDVVAIDLTITARLKKDENGVAYRLVSDGSRLGVLEPVGECVDRHCAHRASNLESFA